MSLIKKGYVETSGGQLHFRQRDGGGTPVVLLHQTASSSAMWEAVMKRLDGAGPLVALDTPGFGGSFDPEGWPDMPQYAAWIGEAIDGLGIDRYHVLGHHTGACIAAELAVAMPERVASMQLIGPVPLTADERAEFRQHFSEPIGPTPGGEYLKTTWDYLAGLGADKEILLHHRELLDTARAYRGRAQAYNSVWDQDWTALYERIDCPLLLMCARDDVLWPFFERAREMKPAATAVELTGANFEPDLDPAGVAAAVKAFLSNL